MTQKQKMTLERWKALEGNPERELTYAEYLTLKKKERQKRFLEDTLSGLKAIGQNAVKSGYPEKILNVGKRVGKNASESTGFS